MRMHLLTFLFTASFCAPLFETGLCKSPEVRQSDPLGSPGPLCWLILQDDRVVPFDPTDPMLPFRWATTWPDKRAASSAFQPVRQSANRHHASEQSFEALVLGLKGIALPTPEPARRKTRVVQQPSLIAGSAFGIGMLAIGVGGWIALAASAFVLARRASEGLSINLPH